jgi:hypothetical protein
MENHSGMLAYPLSSKDILTCTIPRPSDNIKRDNIIENTISKLKEDFGLDVCCYEEDTTIINESESDALIQCLLNTIYYHMISSKNWFSFSIDGQSRGVIARESTDDSSFFDSVLLQGCTINAHGMRSYMFNVIKVVKYASLDNSNPFVIFVLQADL